MASALQNFTVNLALFALHIFKCERLCEPALLNIVIWIIPYQRSTTFFFIKATGRQRFELLEKQSTFTGFWFLVAFDILGPPNSLSRPLSLSLSLSHVITY